MFVSDFCLLAQSHSFASLIGILSLLQRYDRYEADADDQQQPRVDDIMRGNVPPNSDDVVGIENQQQQPRDDFDVSGDDADIHGHHQQHIFDSSISRKTPGLVFGTR